MKRILIFLTITYSLILVGVEVTVAQEGVKFDRLIHNFGDLKESDGVQTCSFSFKNIGKDPVVVQTVVASCGCTAPNWTKKPILPGEKGEIIVKFMNNQGAYPFDKSMTVYITGEKRPVVLRIKGVVHDKPKKLSQLFPIKFGELGFKHLSINLGYVAQGESKTDVITVANISKKKIKVEFKNQTPGLSLSISPQTLAPEEKGEISFTVNTDIKHQRWGICQYTADILINGQVVSQSKRPIVEVCIRDNFSNLTKEQTDKAALPIADENSYEFGIVKKGATVSKIFIIKNIGRESLKIHKIDSSIKGISLNRYETEIKPGMSVKINATVNTSELALGETTIILSLITNSPIRPIFNLFLSGIIK